MIHSPDSPVTFNFNYEAAMAFGVGESPLKPTSAAFGVASGPTTKSTPQPSQNHFRSDSKPEDDAHFGDVSDPRAAMMYGHYSGSGGAGVLGGYGLTSSSPDGGSTGHTMRMVKSRVHRMWETSEIRFLVVPKNK